MTNRQVNIFLNMNLHVRALFLHALALVASILSRLVKCDQRDKPESLNVCAYHTNYMYQSLRMKINKQIHSQVNSNIIDENRSPCAPQLGSKRYPFDTWAC